MPVVIDPNSPTWRNLRAYIEERRAGLRDKLETKIDWDETCRVRAQLEELSRLLSVTEVDVPLIDHQDFELPN